MNKRNKGITLIALVITIIVLLILAGVTIAMVLGQDGIFKKAEEAKRLTTISQEKEIISLGMANIKVANLETMILENEQVKASQLQSEIEAKAYTVQVTGSNADGTGTLTVHYLESGNRYTVTQTGEITGPGNGGGEEPEEPDNPSTKVLLSEVVQRGDYIDYSEGNGQSYTASSSQTGYSQNQIFTTKDDIQWRVLDVIDGKVLLISKEGIRPTSGSTYALYLNGKEGYKNAENILNNIGELYSHGQYAESGRSINVKDIDRIVGITESDKKKYYEHYGNSYEYSSGTFINEDGTEIKASNSNKVTIKTTFYTYKPENTPNASNTESIEYKLLFDPMYSYWLASRGAVANPLTYAAYDMFYVNASWSTGVSGQWIYNSKGEANENHYYVRPVIILEADVLKTGGSGTSSKPYTLGK